MRRRRNDGDELLSDAQSSSVFLQDRGVRFAADLLHRALRVDVRFNHLVVPPCGESPDISLILTGKSGGAGVTMSELQPKEFSDNNDPITAQRSHVTVRVTVWTKAGVRRD